MDKDQSMSADLVEFSGVDGYMLLSCRLCLWLYCFLCNCLFYLSVVWMLLLLCLSVVLERLIG